MSKLNEQFGVSEKDIERLMSEADSEKDSLSNLSQKELDDIKERKDKVNSLKKDLKDARGMKNTQWAESIIKSSVENAVIAQHLAIGDLEDDFQSKKVTSLSELTNAISSGASELVKLEHAQENLQISREKVELRRQELSGGKLLDSENSKDIMAIGTTKDLLKLVNSGNIEEESDESDESINTSEENNGETNE